MALEPARGLPYFALIVAFVNAVLAGRRAAITGLAASYAGILWLPGLAGVSAFGTAGGLLLGGFLGWALAEAGARSSGLTTASFPAMQLIVIANLGGAAGILAAIRPARRAARLPVLRAIAAE